MLTIIFTFQKFYRFNNILNGESMQLICYSKNMLKTPGGERNLKKTCIFT